MSNEWPIGKHSLNLFFVKTTAKISQNFDPHKPTYLTWCEMLFIALRLKLSKSCNNFQIPRKNLNELAKPAKTCKREKNRHKSQNHEQNYKSTPEITQNFDPFKPTHLKMVYNAMYRFKNMLFGPRIFVAFTKRYEKINSTHSFDTPTPAHIRDKCQDTAGDYT